jgi:hypothetical protein
VLSYVYDALLVELQGVVCLCAFAVSILLNFNVRILQNVLVSDHFVEFLAVPQFLMGNNRAESY